MFDNPIKKLFRKAKQVKLEKEKKNFAKEIANLENLIVKNSALLVNKNFLASAPKEIVENNKTKLAEYKEKLKSQKDLLDNLKKLS